MLDTRISHDFTRKELADYTGISLADISKLENGKESIIKVIKTACGWYGYDFEN